MQKYYDVVQNKLGLVVEGAKVLVTDSNGSVASIYSNNATTPIQQTNPMTTDALGRFSFYAADGRYNLKVTIDGVDYGEVRDILLNDPADPSAEKIDGGVITNSQVNSSEINDSAIAGGSAEQLDISSSTISNSEVEASVISNSTIQNSELTSVTIDGKAPATLDNDGKIPVANLPSVSLTETFPVSSQAAMLALNAQPGDVAIRSDVSKSFILMASPASTLSNWVEMLNDAYVRLSPMVLEALRRSYSEAGYSMDTAESFEKGGTIATATEVLLYESAGVAYSWGGALPKVVPAGSTPASSGGVGVGLWQLESNKILRSALASQSGASLVFTSTGESVQNAIDKLRREQGGRLLSKIKFKTQLANSPWGQPGPVNVLGDSISFGYFASYESGSPTAGGMYYHRWISIFARMLAAEFNTGHYITCNPNIYEYGGDEDVSKRTSVSGTWTLKNTGLYTSNLLVGQASCTSTQGDYMEFTFPATFDECWVHYVVQPGGGELSISQNGAAPTVISCADASFKTAAVRLNVTPNPQGYCVVRVTKSDAGSGEVGVSAVSPSQGVRENGVLDGGGLNVFAAPGRRLQDLSESVISSSCQNASALILALGFNDNPLNGSGQEAGRSAFTQRINWVISYCIANNTPLIVADFSWKNTQDQFTRMELKRAADEVGGIYIPLPDMLKNGTFPTEAERLSSGMWYDAAHPSKKGHKWIAESIAKSIGLSCSSKNDALRFHDYWVSLPLSTTYANTLTNIPRNLAAYKVTGDSIQIRTQIKLAAGGNFPTGVINICGTAVNSMFWILPPVKFSSFYLTKLHDVNEGTGVIQGYSAFSGAGAAAGVIRLVRPTGVTLTSFNGASSFEIERWESVDV